MRPLYNRRGRVLLVGLRRRVASVRLRTSSLKRVIRGRFYFDGGGAQRHSAVACVGFDLRGRCIVHDHMVFCDGDHA